MLEKERENVGFISEFAQNDIKRLETERDSLAKEKGEEKAKIIEMNERVEKLSEGFQKKVNECDLLK